MANRWGNSGNSVRLYFGGSKITADGDSSHEIKRHLLLGRKATTKLDSKLKAETLTLPTKVHIVKVMVVPVVMYRCESWTIKKAEHWRTDAFELWYWRRLLRVPWTARRSSQSILKEISSLEGLMLKLKLQYFGTWCKELTHLKRPWCWERLKTEEEDDRGWDGWMASLTHWTWVWASSGDGDGQGCLACCSPWGCKELDKTEQLKWTENHILFFFNNKCTNVYSSLFILILFIHINSELICYAQLFSFSLILKT